MSTLLHEATGLALASALESLGYPALTAALAPCPRPDMGDAACNAPLQAARVLKRAPMSIAADLAFAARSFPGVARAEAAAPGYVNVTFSAEAVAAAVRDQASGTVPRIPPAARAEHVVIDFGGPNIKPMHVGHMRSVFIGESLRRILASAGHTVVSDIHLGDWGLPAGMILEEIRIRDPGSPWFIPGEPRPDGIPIDEAGLASAYPAAAAACKADAGRMAGARAVTAALQGGDPVLTALWSAIVERAKESILATCTRMGAHFDLTLGESDAQPGIPAMLAALEESGAARRDGSALLMDLTLAGDLREMPPLVLEKGDGSALYATTDLSTLASRVRDMGAERVLYVVDNRQALHFAQVFRAAGIGGISGAAQLEHVGFGTVNGLDGKPFRTRDGTAMSLVELLDTAASRARERLVAGGRMDGGHPGRIDNAAEAIGMAALRIADLAGNRMSGYVLDLDRALSFEGRTGPYLLYTQVRLRSILAHSADAPGTLLPGNEAERRLGLACLGLGAAVHRAAAGRAPHEMVAYAFDLAAAVGRFYLECPVLSEPDRAVRESRLALCVEAERALGTALELVGCRVPPAM